MATKLILGAPGCGKTTRLLEIVNEAISQGTAPEEIAFISYTKAAAGVATERAIQKFKLERTRFPYFRTIHSLAFQGTGAARNEVLDRNDYKEFANLMGVEFSGYLDVSENPVIGNKEGDAMLAMISLHRSTGKLLSEVWREYSSDTISWHKVKQFAESFDQYKQDLGKIDFADMLSNYCEQGAPLPIKLAIVDEGQDLSQAQWDVVKTAFRFAENIYIAGDDDQAIYKWSGACVDKFLDVKAEQEVLPISYRLPEEIYNLANNISKRISERFVKTWDHSGKSGSVNHINGIDSLDFTEGSWMVLARNSYMLKDYAESLKLNGILYSTNKGSSVNADHTKAIIAYETLRKGKRVQASEIQNFRLYIRGFKLDKLGELGIEDIPLDWTKPWYSTFNNMEDVDYYRSLLKNGFKLTGKPNVYLGTIHSVKGGEADNVVLCTDMSYKTYTGYERFPDDEHRVFYVGATRAKKNLYIDSPKTDRFYVI